MAKFKICENCGGNIDHGEKCDCAERDKPTGWNALACEIHENAVAHGWWEGDRYFAEIIALFHSELSEALEEYRNGRGNLYFEEQKPAGITVELADCVIRILDYCGRHRFDVDEAMKKIQAVNEAYALPPLVTECHYFLAQVYRGDSKMLNLARCIALIKFWCAKNGVDLEEIIRLKHEYNKKRPYRHGEKAC